MNTCKPADLRLAADPHAPSSERPAPCLVALQKPWQRVLSATKRECPLDWNRKPFSHEIHDVVRTYSEQALNTVLLPTSSYLHPTCSDRPGSNQEFLYA